MREPAVSVATPGSAPLPDVPRASLAHRLEFAAFRLVVKALSSLGWRRASRFGAMVGALGYRPFGIRRNVVQRQIAAAFPELDEAERRRIARGAYENLGRVALETAILSAQGAAALDQMFERVEGWEHAEAALAQGKGMIVVAGHLSNWEIAGAYIGRLAGSMDAVARRMGNPLFERYLTESRARLGVTVVPDSEAVRRVPRVLREGRTVGFLFDQGVKGLASTFVPFFGRPAKTPRGPAVFAIRYGAPVIFAAPIRQPGGRYLLHLEAVPVEETGDRERDVDLLMARCTEALERCVRRAPEQYFWHHRRWRRQPKDTPPELREP